MELKNKLTRNLGMKVISVLVAIVIWLIISSMIDPVETTTIKNIPVTTLNVESMETINKLYVIVSGETVDIKVKAKSSIISQLSAADFQATADFRNVVNEFGTVMIDVVCTTYDENDLEITEQKTKVMTLELEDLETQSFAVSVVPEGTVTNGYCVTESLASPNLITISGSKTLVSSIAKVVVSANVQDCSQSFSFTGTPVAYDRNGDEIDTSKITMSATTVKVSINILPTKEIALRVVTSGTPYYTHAFSTIEYAPKTVLIAGDASDLRQISYLELTCDIEGAVNDVETELSISAKLDSKYTLVDDNDKVNVKVTIVEKEVKDIIMSTGYITVENLPDNLEAVTQTVTCTLTLLGTEDVLSKTGYSALAPFIDCSGCTEPGTYTLPIQTQEISGIVVLEASIEIIVTEKQFNIQDDGVPEASAEMGDGGYLSTADKSE